VWHGGSGSQFVSSGPQQFLVRADGGVGINSSALPAGIEMLLASRGGPGNVDLYMRSTAHPRGINIAMLPTAGAAEMRIAQYDGARSSTASTSAQAATSASPPRRSSPVAAPGPLRRTCA
jgi:trimeric autotransporter adhesin